MRRSRVEESTPGPALSTPARAANIRRLMNAVDVLDIIADAATAKRVQAEIEQEWLRPMAAIKHGDVPEKLLVRWMNLFSDELETVRRARDNIVYSEYLDDESLAAAADIAERLRSVAEEAGRAMLKRQQT